jgi:hypothetical protein
MSTVTSKQILCPTSTSSVLTRIGTRTGISPQVDLLGVRVREKKRKKEKRLGYLPKKELIAEVRKIFPNATVLPNRNEYQEKRQTEERKALSQVR